MRSPIRFPQALRAWNTEGFERCLKTELEQLPAGAFPLHLAADAGGFVDHREISVILLKSEEDGASLQVRFGVFFREMPVACNCSEEPERRLGYCEWRLSIDKASGEGKFTLLSD